MRFAACGTVKIIERNNRYIGSGHKLARRNIIRAYLPDSFIVPDILSNRARVFEYGRSSDADNRDAGQLEQRSAVDIFGGIGHSGDTNG